MYLIITITVLIVKAQFHSIPSTVLNVTDVLKNLTIIATG